MRHYTADGMVHREDTLAGEEPLEVRVGGSAMAVTMRTPGHDIELVHGFLHSEGVITGREDVQVARYCEGVDAEGRNTYNVIDVQLAGGRSIAGERIRTVTGTSACGVCGTAAIDAVAQHSRFAAPDGPMLSPTLVLSLPDLLRSRQRQFARTGGVHACALVAADGSVLELREDVGRHNAMDKVIGSALLAGGLPLADRLLVTSSRASFELVQKAVLAGCGVLVAFSAASSLAVELARDRDLTLIAFSRSDSFNVYSGARRIAA